MCALASAPGWTASSSADRFGPGYSIPDAEGNPGTSHIGAYGPPGTTIHGTDETYCADPERRGPDSAGAYGAPKAVSSWTSSVTGKPVPAEDLRYAAYVVSRYGQTRDPVQAAAVDADVYQWLAGGTYGINGSRGRQRLAYPVVPAAARTLALRYLTEAARYAGPYTLRLTLPAAEVHAGQKVTATVKVTSTSTGAPIPDVAVAWSESGSAIARGTVTTGTDGSASWTFRTGQRGTATLTAEASGLPATGLQILRPRNPAAQRMLLAGTTSTAKDTVSMAVRSAPGGIEIHKTDPGGGHLAGVTFQLLDQTGKTVVAHGVTDSRGVLDFENLPPGTYRLHEVSAGDRIHQLAPDQSVTVTEGQTAAAHPITVVDEFTPAALTVRKTDKTTGRPLPGATITIRADTVDAHGQHAPGPAVLTLTTGHDGLAHTSLDVVLKNGTRYWATETAPPAGYRPDATPVSFTARPGTTVTITLTDTPTPSTPSPGPSTPTTTPPRAAPPSPSAPASPSPRHGTLAHTGADAGLALAITAGILTSAGAVLLAGSYRRNRRHDRTARR
ncbi:collagen binding domain-containing protein [Streptomyces sp. HPF1205]|uniref:MSCRAMM family protein n=1 Tax=Streptomyces sp. HPF1205 TaxID=2873262 RepID=UPI001CED2BDE|nr:SpaA isopeptide-forming pilin-related protein [Streptomyces sp. HPF1205]